MLKLDESTKILRRNIASFPATVIVLGSGWNKILDEIKTEFEIQYSDLFGVSATVPGHEGKLVIGSVSGKKIAFMSGRFHMYEGYSAEQATLPYRVFANAGMKNLVLTAASGGLNEKYRVGDFVVLDDIVTLFLAMDNPVKGPFFTDMSQCFDRELRKTALSIAKINGFPAQEGSYVYYHGPNFETPADKRALRLLGADVCGMSTVPETLVARSLNIKVLGLALVTNLAFVKHDHKEVLAESLKASARMATLLKGIIEAI